MACHLYAIACDGYVKIGQTYRVEQRLRSLQAASPNLMRLVGVAYGYGHHELVCHRIFESFRLHGEWFSPQVLRYIEEEMSKTYVRYPERTIVQHVTFLDVVDRLVHGGARAPAPTADEAAFVLAHNKTAGLWSRRKDVPASREVEKTNGA